ncbi:YitT family protein [Paenibacillus faecalis]|uniref:YitT family protein n=1 Tax=Paenibacillus faecalis TaxID=2079532 RepID=UPI000D0E8EF8|nr:YitT family protein [Paenibacillus faecalis]
MIKYLWSYLAIILGGIVIACGFNLFIIPHHLLSGGVSGVAILISYFSPFNISIMYFVLNIPILIAGWIKLGKRFVWLSILSVLVVTLLLEIIPVQAVAPDMLLSAVFGGVLVGLGGGLSFRVGGSTGGFDIIGSLVTRHRDFPVGNVLVGMNTLVILAVAYLEQDWNIALASMLSMYLTGKVIDLVHISHIKVTLFIVTDKTEDLLEKLLKRPRGVTKIRTEGAFTHKEKDMLMTVTTKYELAELKAIITETDPEAFVNVVETIAVMGQFRRS